MLIKKPSAYNFKITFLSTITSGVIIIYKYFYVVRMLRGGKKELLKETNTCHFVRDRHFLIAFILSLLLSVSRGMETN